MKKPPLIVVCGPNGSGKTSITKKILKHEWLDNCTYINPDEIARDIYGDWNSPQAVLSAANHAKELRETLLKEKSSIIFETVLSGLDKIDFILKAKEQGYFIRIFFVCSIDNYPHPLCQLYNCYPSISLCYTQNSMDNGQWTMLQLTITPPSVNCQLYNC